MDKLRIGILFGGTGEEHPVSIKSAAEVAKSLAPCKYEPYYIGITRDGEWKLCTKPSAKWEEEEYPSAILSPDRKNRGLLVLRDGKYTVIPLDIVFPVLHGKTGEDGVIQGLLELSGLPYIGCDIVSSVMCMDKAMAYAAVAKAGVRTPKYWVLGGGDEVGSYNYPVFVKPARSGSSFGVSKAENPGELQNAIALAGQYDTKILIEEAVEGIEIGCAVLDCKSGLFTGEADQITLSHGFFKIHQEDNPEQGSENSMVKVPADISPQARELAKETAKKIFRTLGCRGLARIDMFVSPEGEIILNEINTMPGLTSYSRYPRMMAAKGLTLSQTIERLIEETLGG